MGEPYFSSNKFTFVLVVDSSTYDHRSQAAAASAEVPPSGYHRKRSSSLPRILPPILDDDDDEQEMVVPEGHRRDQVRQRDLNLVELQNFSGHWENYGLM
jgi:hypothetical protein